MSRILAYMMLFGNEAVHADSGSPLGHYLLALGLLLVTISLMMRLRKRHRKRPLNPAPLENAERIRQMRGMRGDLEEVMVEIEQLAKRFGSQLDAKTVQLEHLLAEADAKIQRLRTLQDQVSDQPVVAANTSTPRNDAGPSGMPNDPLARSVYTLADRGSDSAEIARTLNEHVGKVELILALRGGGGES